MPSEMVSTAIFTFGFDVDALWMRLWLVLLQRKCLAVEVDVRKNVVVLLALHPLVAPVELDDLVFLQQAVQLLALLVFLALRDRKLFWVVHLCVLGLAGLPLL